MASPSPGWYPSPDRDPNWLQYWDGTQWTPHRAPSGAGFATRQEPPLTPSGMRRVSALFTDAMTILKRAWWPIVAVSALLWGLWALVLSVLSAVLRFGDWADLWRQLLDLDGNYPEGIPLSVEQDLQQQATDLFNAIGAGTWIAAGVALVLATFLVFSLQYAAVYRIGAEAASGRPVNFASGMAGIRAGALRIIGYNLLIALAVGALYAVAILPLLFTHLPQALAFTLFFVLLLLTLGVALGIAARLTPAFVQASLPGGAGALGWSWRATKGKSWAVLGRYLLWSLVASLVINLVLSVLSVPFSFLLIALVFLPSGALLAVGLIGLVVMYALSSLTLLGAVPIWRDLTTDPDYRAIAEDGAVVAG